MIRKSRLKQTTAISLVVAAAATLLSSQPDFVSDASAYDYLPSSPYEKRRASNRKPLYPQAASSAPAPVASPSVSTRSKPFQVAAVPQATTQVLPDPSSIVPPKRMVSTLPKPILMPRKPLYPSKAGALPQVPNLQPATPAYSAATAHAQAPNVPQVLPLPEQMPSGEMPKFKPYATIETQKEVPLNPMVHNVPQRAVPVRGAYPMPQAKPQPEQAAVAEAKPKPIKSLASPQTIPPAPAVKSDPIRIAQPTVGSAIPPAEPMTLPLPGGALPAHSQAQPPVQPMLESLPGIDVAPPASPLHPETQRILSKLPTGVDTPRGKGVQRLAVKRYDPDIEGILNAAPFDEDDVQTHESTGVKIQVRRPSFNTDYELEKAYNALTSGQTEIAIEIYKDILRQSAGNQDALFGIATCYHRVGELDLARPFYGKLLRINPQHRDALNNFLVLVAEESPEDALHQMEALEMQNPDFSPIPAQLAMLYDKLGNPEAARQKMIRAVRLAPENLAYKYNLAILLDKQGKFADAEAIYRDLVHAAHRGETLPTDVDEIEQRLVYIGSLK